MSKLGAPYRWGATGPSSFDCSGLVSWAYKKVGVSLPRTSRAMSRVGRAVPKSALRPGDLVFFYTPVSHVGIYIGGGKVVNASRPGTPVKVSNISGMPFNSARRL
jgi:cell wall-associated NlpC family hydrolase